MHFGRKKTLIDRAQDYVEQISDTVRPQIESAWEQAVDKTGPALSDARDKATPLMAEGRARAAEAASAGAAIAAERAHYAAALASEKASAGRDLAAAKVAGLKPEPEPKGGKLKKLLLVGGLLAVAGFLYTKFKSSQNDSSNWQSSYVPTPPPAPKPAPVPSPPKASTDSADTPTSDDTGGGAPGEALSDSVEEPKKATTPDQPADVIDIDDVPKDPKS